MAHEPVAGCLRGGHSPSLALLAFDPILDLVVFTLVAYFFGCFITLPNLLGKLSLYCFLDVFLFRLLLCFHQSEDVLLEGLELFGLRVWS